MSDDRAPNTSGNTPTKNASSSEDWMQVLDNFLDNDENQQQQHQNSHARTSHPATASSDHQTAIATAAAAAAAAVSNNNDVPPAQTTSESTGSDVAVASSAHSLTGSDNLDNTDLSEDVKTQIRSERKRTREKQRRSDVNAQFAALTELLKRVEGYDLDSDVSDDEDDSCKKKPKLSTSVTVVNATPSNRVDLIARTISIMDRLHKVNRSLRTTIKGLRKTMKKMNNVDGDMKKPGMMYSNGMMFGQNGQFPGMMMMMPPGMQQMGMMGNNMGGGMGQQNDQVGNLLLKFSRE